MNEELLSRLDQLANKLGTTIDYLWPKLTTYAQLQATTATVVLSVFTIGLTTALVKLLKEDKPDKPADPFNMSVGPEFVIGVLAIAIALCVLGISYCIPVILVPEVAALKTLREIIK